MSILVIPWQIVRAVAPQIRAVPTSPIIDPGKIEIEFDRMKLDEKARRLLDEPPADPTPPPKPKKDLAPTPQPTPQPQPEPEKGPWKTDPKTCTIVRDADASQALKTQACIAWNVAQAMTEAYNRGYADGRKASKRWETRCTNARSSTRWLNQRLKRILLSQDKPQKYKRTVISRNK